MVDEGIANLPYLSALYESVKTHGLVKVVALKDQIRPNRLDKFIEEYLTIVKKIDEAFEMLHEETRAEIWAKYESAAEIQRWDSDVEMENRDIGFVLEAGAREARKAALNDKETY